MGWPIRRKPDVTAVVLYLAVSVLCVVEPLRHIPARIRAHSPPESDFVVRRLLRQLGFSLQANAKVSEGSSQHPDRDAQFAYLNDQAAAHLAAGDPVISVDAKKKENIGEFRNGGREWQPKGSPEPVNVHDFIDKELGKVTPYGIYDVAANAGRVSVGTDHDTAAFAVTTIARWWQAVGQPAYPAAAGLLICADGGGSNGYRTRLWKTELAAVVAVAGVPADDEGVREQGERDGALDGALDPVAGLAGAQHVAGVGECLFDRPPGGVPRHQRSRGGGQVGGDQGQVIAAGSAPVADQDQPDGPGVPGPVPQAGDLGDVLDVLPPVGGDGDRGPGRGGGDVIGGAEPAALGAGPAALTGARRRQVIQHRVARDPAGPGHVLREGAQRRTVIGGVGHDMDHPAGERQREQPDQGRGRLHLGRPGALAGQVQPGQHRQADLAGAERQPDQDGRDHEAVAVAELVLRRGAAVMLPPGPVHLAPGPPEHRVIDGHAQVRAGRQHQQRDQLRDRQAELIDLPSGPGEEVMCPIMRRQSRRNRPIASHQHHRQAPLAVPG